MRTRSTGTKKLPTVTDDISVSTVDVPASHTKEQLYYLALADIKAAPLRSSLVVS